MTTQKDFEALLNLVATLRAPGGCPWDREQTHESLKVCLQEETGEVLEAIDKKDDENLCEELGDLLLQVVMHAQIATEENRFTIDDVLKGISDKLVRRHPHVFGDEKATTPEEGISMWRAMKERENLHKG